MSAKEIMMAASAAAALPIEYVGGYSEGFSGRTPDVTINFTPFLSGPYSAPSENDLVIVYFATASSSVDRNLTVSGYTEVVELYSNDVYATNLVVAYKFMGSTPDTSFTLTGGTGSSNDAGRITVQVFRGVDQTTPMDVTRTTATGSGTILCNPPAITPISDGAVIVAGGAGASDRYTPLGTRFFSSDLTEFFTNTTNDVNDITMGLGHAEWTSGTFDPAQFTFNAADGADFSWAAVTMALRPAT